MGPRFANGSGRNSSSNDIWWNRNDNKGTITDHTIATDGHTLKNLDIGTNRHALQPRRAKRGVGCKRGLAALHLIYGSLFPVQRRAVLNLNTIIP